MKEKIKLGLNIGFDKEQDKIIVEITGLKLDLSIDRNFEILNGGLRVLVTEIYAHINNLQAEFIHKKVDKVENPFKNS